jgi:uncharacterized protein (DUF924 family)
MEWQAVLDFWFKDATPADWFRKSDDFDEKVRTRFGALYERVALGDTVGWRASPEGRLAEIIVLDQFPRNMFRNSPKSFATDGKALELAREAVALGIDKKLSAKERHFLYMPYMHSESRDAHRTAVWLFLRSMNWEALRYEWEHKKIIDRFGRYPHRNAILGRESTPEELEFLKTHKGF